jgi:hypothetical protein
MAFEPIENYAVIGNIQSIALVGMNGSIDFLCTRISIRQPYLLLYLMMRKGGALQFGRSCPTCACGNST